MAAEPLIEEVVEGLEQMAVTTRRLNGSVIGSFCVGIGVGVAVGFFIGYRYNKKKLRIDAFVEAEKEIEVMREHYRVKTLALVDREDKKTIDEIIQDRGYAITDDEEISSTDSRRLRPPVPVTAAPFFPPRHVQDHSIPQTWSRPPKRTFKTDAASKDPDDDWDYDVETQRRSVDVPYIIHQKEFELQESGYNQVEYVYYQKDDVLVDEDDITTILANRENIVGPDALQRFGHGSDDYNVVYVRNSYLELEITINRVKESWEDEVQGLESHDTT